MKNLLRYFFLKRAFVFSVCLGCAFFVLVFGVLGVSPAKAEEVETGPVGLTGDWGGYRAKLQDNGIDINANEVLDFLGNTNGGTSRGVVLDGILAPTLDVDFEKLADIHDLTAHVSAFQVHGRGLSASNLNNNIATVSNIEAARATRLFELWVQKTFADKDISLRLGELAADQEFITTKYGALFINSAYGWPSSLAANLPAGGPGYPLAAPGARLRVGQNDPLSFQIGVYDGDPSGGPGTESAQDRNGSGAKFPVDHGILIMSEADYSRTPDKVDLPGTYKLGFWYHTENFLDPRYGSDGLSLSDISSNGNAKTYHGNYGFYGVVDQMLWHTADSQEKGVGAFARLLWNPSDRNTVAYQIDAGINVIGMMPGRENDVLGVAFTYLPISDRAIGADNDSNTFNSTNAPVRDYESQVEVTYQAPINDWLTLQPDFQYVFHPGGNVVDPNDTAGTKPVGDAVIFGIRAVAKL